MDFVESVHHSDARLTVESHLPKIGKKEIISRILADLSRTPKKISSLYFYDPAGSKLFERITNLPEYYPTRVEKKILKKAAADIGPTLRELDVVEIGSGDASKISILLNATSSRQRDSLRYVPVDVSRSAVEQAAENLLERFPALSVHAVIADFASQIHHIPASGRRMFCFFGSTIGNLEREQGYEMCRRLGAEMRVGETFLLGLDRIKPREILERAYNDAQDVTATFNRNVLNVVNRLADMDFLPDQFEHIAFYNDQKLRIEMHLKAPADIEIHTPHAKGAIKIRRGEKIHTENSHKYNEEHIERLSEASGLEIDKIYSDDRRWFSIVKFKKA